MTDDPKLREWMASVQDGTPNGPKLHFIRRLLLDGRPANVAAEKAVVTDASVHARSLMGSAPAAPPAPPES